MNRKDLELDVAQQALRLVLTNTELPPLTYGEIERDGYSGLWSVHIGSIGRDGEDKQLKLLAVRIKSHFKKQYKCSLEVDFCGACARLSPPPSAQEVIGLRESYGLKPARSKLEVPGFFPAGQHPAIGSFTMYTKGKQTFIRSKLWGNKRFGEHDVDELCIQAKKSGARLKIGWAIASMAAHDGYQTYDSIGHPLEAINHSSEAMHIAQAWRHWAVAKV